MIQAVFVVNNSGKLRLSKFYSWQPLETQNRIVGDVFRSLARRSEDMCNFLEAGDPWIEGTKIVYRHYATLYFVFIVDGCESELSILDLIHIFVETLDQRFDSVCELDLIFHMDKVLYILDEIIVGGLVMDTNQDVILEAVEGQSKLQRGEAPLRAGIKDAVNKGLGGVFKP